MNEINFQIEDIEKIDLSMDVGVKEIYPPIENLEVTPTKEQQVFKHENSYGYDEVVVDPIPDEYIIPDGTLPITENATYDVRKFARVSTSVHPAPNLQDKELIINENGTQNITADEGYDGLNQVSVTVNAIEDLIEELNTYNTELTEQEIKIADVIELLQTKAVGESDVKYTPRKICFYKYDGTDLDYEVAKLDTSNITNMDNMFQGCKNITSLNLSHFITDKVTSMTAMFRDCTSLTFLDIRNFNFTNVAVYNYFLYTVPADCLIIVKDDIQKNWLLDNIGAALNIKTVEEYGG